MPIINEPEDKMKLDTATEPVRLSGWAALTVGLALLAVIGLAAGAPVAAVILQVASVALASIGGLEFARRHVTPNGKLPSQPASTGFVHYEDEDEQG